MLTRDVSPKAFSGSTVVAFPDWFDKNVAPRIGYLPGPMKDFLGPQLVAHGFKLKNAGAFFPDGSVHRDGNLLTGDSPDAANELGRQGAALLLHKLLL